MTYLDPPQPDAITWDGSGVSVVSDGYERHFTDQAGLRIAASEATRPKVTVKALARRVKVSEDTLRGFMRGRSLQPENAENLRAALQEMRT
jgi:nitrate/TMAO reductase-like tetraheme cytochrome c subunit